MSEVQDSRPDTFAHIVAVQGRLFMAVQDLLVRAHLHDASKLVEPELSMFNVYRRKLDEVDHDSAEYRQHLKDMGDALQHHYQVNRHHPEHFGEEGYLGMTLLDLVEMVCDWAAASARQAPDDPQAALEAWISGAAKERFGYSAELARILLNTAQAELQTL